MRHVIVGNGIAGITAAAQLARRQAGEIAVYSAERHPYYFRPQLPGFVAGEVSQDVLYAHPPSWYGQKGIAVHLDTAVTGLVLHEKRALLAGGDEVPYDRLLLATGAVPAVPPIEGTDREGVFTLRTLDDALAIRHYAAGCREAVVIGGGLLGLEAARALTALGLSVTALEYFPRLCPRQLDDEGATVFQQIVENLGIGVGLSADARSILGDGRVQGVVLQDGREFPAQMVVVAAGVRCRAGLARDAGLEVERGIVVDERMSTSAPDVYAAGDSASFLGRSWGIIPVARAQALVAAANMAGDEVTYEEVTPSTTLKIVGVELTSIGTVMPDEEGFEEIRRSDPDTGMYRKLVMDGDTMVGAIVIGDRALARKLERLIADRAELSRQEVRGLLETDSA